MRTSGPTSTRDSSLVESSTFNAAAQEQVAIAVKRPDPRRRVKGGPPTSVPATAPVPPPILPPVEPVKAPPKRPRPAPYAEPIRGPICAPVRWGSA